MGGCYSNSSLERGASAEDIQRFHDNIMRSLNIPIELQVAHYTPSTFPVYPIITPETAKLCEASWLKIISISKVDSSGKELSGVCAFYMDFYEKLEYEDRNGIFEALLSKNRDSEDQIVAKGAILVRIIKFALRIANDYKSSQLALFMLGRSHCQKGIRPWQYAVFVQTLLRSISSSLECFATNDVMEAWVNIFAFILQSMLPQAIAGLVVETEVNINTSSEFAAGKVLEEVKYAEDVLKEKKLNRGSSISSSSVGGD